MQKIRLEYGGCYCWIAIDPTAQKFLNYCTDADILLFCLPPHTTHILQPLDVVVFQPYKHWHAQAIDEATCTRYDDSNKIEFLEALGSIRAKTFKTLTILSAFKETGLYPYNPAKMLDKLQAQEKEDEWEDISNPENNNEQPTTPPPDEIRPNKLVSTPLLMICTIKRTFNSVLATPLVPAAQHNIKKL